MVVCWQRDSIATMRFLVGAANMMNVFTHLCLVIYEKSDPVRLKIHFPAVPLVAITATATARAIQRSAMTSESS